jgi:hypothetical protein
MIKGVKMPPVLKKRMIEKQIKLFKHRAKPFHQIDKKTGEIVACWNSLGEIKRLLGYRPYHIQRVLHGEFKTFKGYNWKYI